MKLFKTKRQIAAVAVSGAMVLGAAGAAFAYFTSTGSNTGTATTGSAGPWTVGPVVIQNAAMYPGQASIAVQSSTVQNAGSGTQGLQALTVQITGVAEGAPGNTAPFSGEHACTTADYSLLGSSAPWVISGTGDSIGTYTLGSVANIQPSHYYVNPSGDSAVTGNALPTGLTLKMVNNSSAAQDRCQGATVTLTLSAS